MTRNNHGMKRQQQKRQTQRRSQDTYIYTYTPAKTGTTTTSTLCGSLFRETTTLSDDGSISPQDTHIATDVNNNLYLHRNQQMILQQAYFARLYSTYTQIDFQHRAMDGRLKMANPTDNFVSLLDFRHTCATWIFHVVMTT